ncbi:hypothetical protein [Xanthomarina gelatinilytica]|uniref:hypothetical protein n=1 Tax=Xanthomarina gelatinilytica TaxID=1137281 RepID=UPI003AA86973
MRYKTIILVTVLFSFISCEKKVEIKENRFRTWLNPDFKLENGFSVKLKMTVIHDDVFKIYYSEDPSENYQEKESIQSKVKGSNNNQIITFNLPKDIRPTKLRIDFGINKKQNYFKINSIELNNSQNNLEIPSDSLFNYFEIFNKNLSYDSINNHLKVEKSSNKKYSPSVFSKELLSNKLKDWYKD